MEINLDGVRTRPVAEEDIEPLLAIQGDPAANEHNPAGCLQDRDRGRDKLAGWIADWRDRGIGYWAVEQSAGDDREKSVIGFGGVHYIAAGPGEVFNLYYRFTPAVWGNGYASKVAKAACELASAHDPATPVIARMQPSNRASERVAQRVGLFYDGRDRWGRYVLADRELPGPVRDGLPPVPGNGSPQS